MSASTENALVYNVIQQQIQMTPKNFQLWKSQSTKCAPQMMEGNQQSNNSNKMIPTMNEEANSTHNTMSIQYNIFAKYFCKWAAENTCARGL